MEVTDMELDNASEDGLVDLGPLIIDLNDVHVNLMLRMKENGYLLKILHLNISYMILMLNLKEKTLTKKVNKKNPICVGTLKSSKKPNYW